MAKNLLKKAKKAAKSVSKSAEKVVSAAKHSTSSAQNHIESLSHQRRDAAVVWGMIKDKNLNSAEIREIVKDKGFDVLLGEL